MNVESIVSDCSSPCRLCAQTDGGLIDIYSEEGSALDILDKIKQYVPIEISQTDELSTKCCTDCVSKILSWHKFILHIKETSIILKVKAEESRKLSKGGQEDGEEVNGDAMFYCILKTEDEDDDTNIPESDFHGEQEGYELEDERELLDEADEIIIINPPERPLRKEELDGKFQCELCCHSFTRKSDLLRHMKNHQEGIQFNDSCSENEPFIRTSPRGRKRKTKINKEFSCKVCSNTFTRKHDLLRHMQTVHANLRCDHSTDQSESEELISRPVKMRRKKSQIQKSYFCEICKRGFTRKFDMERHKKEKHPEIPGSNKRANNRDLLKKCRIVENGRKFYECDICKHRTNQSYNLIRHRTIHTGVKAYVCHICGKGFRLGSILRTHVRLFHERLKKFKCDVCQRRFGLKAARDEHMNIHSDNRPFSCDICDKSFRHKSSLYCHRLYHFENFKHECKLCDKKFRRTSELKLHKSLHTGQKPYKCEECGKEFRVSQSLSRHKKLHLKINKEWVCLECMSVFRQERYLKMHAKIHTVEK